MVKQNKDQDDEIGVPMVSAFALMHTC